METLQKNDQMGAYTEAVKSGLYAKKSGLVGKYDNVRRYWEDEITRSFLYPHLQRLVDNCRRDMRRIRILDLGCGSADGFELLTGIRVKNADLQEFEVDLLTPETINEYVGLDLNEDLLNQGREIYGDNPKIRFIQGDFSESLPLGKEEPYDLYFSSFGTCSHHLTDETFIKMMKDIALSVNHKSIVVCDWIGRYSYEWQSLWNNNLEDIQVMDYVVSYIYSEEERRLRQDQLQHIDLRLLGRNEAEKLIQCAEKESGIKINSLCYFDRSVFTGRHMDTGDYNSKAQPIREAVNSLHEMNMRTDLKSLIIDYIPKKGFPFINKYYENLQLCWNTLVMYVSELLVKYNEEERVFYGEIPEVPAIYPQKLQEMMERMKIIVAGVGWLNTGLPRENIIEPQLGYALRNLIMSLQQGFGCAHGLVGIFEIEKEG